MGGQVTREICLSSNLTGVIDGVSETVRATEGAKLYQSVLLGWNSNRDSDDCDSKNSESCTHVFPPQCACLSPFFRCIVGDGRRSAVADPANAIGSKLWRANYRFKIVSQQSASLQRG